MDCCCACSNSISIHAPPRGATRNNSNFFRLEVISIHAPPRGATPFFFAQFYKTFHFNSRPSARGDRRGHDNCTALHHFNSRPSARGDQREKLRGLRRAEISIHAPPRGATAHCLKCWRSRRYFNSRPSARGDDVGSKQGSSFFNFNSRPSARGDADNRRHFHREHISIHAPPRGATRIT